MRAHPEAILDELLETHWGPPPADPDDLDDPDDPDDPAGRAPDPTEDGAPPSDGQPPEPEAPPPPVNRVRRSAPWGRRPGGAVAGHAGDRDGAVHRPFRVDAGPAGPIAAAAAAGVLLAADQRVRTGVVAGLQPLLG